MDWGLEGMICMVVRGLLYCRFGRSVTIVGEGVWQPTNEWEIRGLKGDKSRTCRVAFGKVLIEV